ncbi:MAG: glycosyltransferase, partial [Alphaproteobacteria bacterium]|nr:glycosyltransferase [Alphaproteobacteria bacterium]
LIKHILLLKPDYEITIFVFTTKGIEEVQNLKDLGVKICEFQKYTNTKVSKFKNRYLNKLYNFISKKKLNRRRKIFENFIENNFDIVFYSWPYDIEPINTSKKLFFIPHDFIFTHFFGFHSGHYYTREWWWDQREKLKKFVEKGKAIVSSPYIREEFIRTYPESNKVPDVVFLSSFNDYKKKDKAEIKEKLKSFGITDKYILYANNWALHKNMQPVIGAYYYVKQKYPNIKLIITGYGTGNILCRCNSPYYLDHIIGTEPYDVKSLGLLDDEDFSVVLQGAEMVINSSLCEAGAGSALDAWSIGVPMVMSDIPPFKEQIEFLGVRAELFDPRNSHDIARAILEVLDNPELAEENVKISQKAMKKYTWKNVAQQYINIFEEKD